VSASDMFAQEIAEKVIAALRDEVPVRDLVSIRGAAQFLDCSVQQVRNFMEAGRLRPVMIDSRPRFRLRDLERFVEAAKR
jgi:hypothetical protein